MSRITLPGQEAAGETRLSFTATFLLARWRLRQTAGLLLMACLGFVAAMIIACVVPLFTTLAATSSLQALLQADPARNDLTLSVNTQGLSSSIASEVQSQVPPLIQQKLGPYHSGATYLTIQEPSFLVLAPTSLQHAAPLNLYATPLTALKPHLRLLAGRWPVSNAAELEIVLTPATAQALHLAPGAQLTLQGDFSSLNQTGGTIDPRTAIQAQVVGLFEVQNPAPVFLRGQDFQPVLSNAAPSYTVLTDTSAFLHTLDQTATQLHTNAIFSYLTFQLTWDYPLQLGGVQPAGLKDLINRLFTAQTTVGNFQNNQERLLLNNFSFPYVTQVALYSPTPGSFELLDLLQEYSNRTALVNVPITILTVQIIALLLLFVSLLISMLIERQMVVNALLSSRGASNRQIFWSLFVQGMALCCFGIILGPTAGIILVSTLAAHILPVSTTVVAQSLPAQLFQTIASIGPTALGTLLVALLTIGLIVRYTSGLNIIALRNETARVTRQPFWLRYYLDMLAAIIALSGYGISLYLASIAHEVDITTQDLLLAPITLIAPIFLLLGCLLIFLRLFPWLLRLGGWLAHRGRGAVAMLSLVQMARAPRQVIRMTLLLSLTVAFAIFAQVFSASQTQRINDISAYESGSDFSGTLPNELAVQQLSPGAITNMYQTIHGVRAVSADYTDEGTTLGSGGAQITVEYRAIDPASFAQTIIWSPVYSSQSLPRLLALLPGVTTATLPDGTQGTLVPAIIDQALANQLQLHAGDVFSLSLNNLTEATLNYRIAAIIAHIPTVNSTASASSSDSPGGMLVSYQALTRVYLEALTSASKNQQATLQTGSAPPVPINHLWLRTDSDAASLTAVRAALNASPLALSSLYDRREIASELQNDPFTLNILIILGIGGLTAFLLAFIGNLISSWISVRNRSNSFVVMRALGATSGQIAGILLWEQGIVYLGAIGLGLAFGAVLATVSVPVLVFTGLPAHGPMSTLSIDDLYLLQHALPAKVIVPFSLDLIFISLVLICLVALLTMIYVALHPSISSELRLGDD